MPARLPGKAWLGLPVLYRKAVRDLIAMGGGAAAIALVMGCGVATFVMALSALDSVKRALDSYYDRSGFPHVFVDLKRAPLALARRLEEIPGVSRMQTRIVREVTLDMRGMAEPAVGHMISLPREGAPAINRVYLRSGRLPLADVPDEVAVLEAFAQAHSLTPGDTVAAVINGRLRDLRIVGTVLSPEFVYPVRPGEMLPDNKHYGVFWMDERQLGPAFDLDGAFNSAVFMVSPGAGAKAVIDAVDQLTAPYGGTGAYAREDQVSHRFLVNEIAQLRAQAIVVPAIFLGVTAFLMQMVMSRVLTTEREQIATLKAFGYTPWGIMRHYLGMVSLIAGAGAAVGIAAGVWLGSYVTRLYAGFFRFPVFEYRLAGWIVAAAVGVAMSTAILATIGPIRRATAVPPAEAMRPEAPARYRRSVLELLRVWRHLSAGGRMIVRNVERRPIRSLMTSMGAAVAVAVLVLGSFIADTIDFLMEFQFNRANRQTLTVTFVEPTGPRAVSGLVSIPGVLRVEAYRAVPARITAGRRSRRLAVMGLGDSRELFPLLDRDGREMELPAAGVMISRELARVLGVRVGDTLQIEVLEGERPVAAVPVGALIDDLSGLNAYMPREELWRLMQEGPTCSGAFVLADQDMEDAVYRELKETPRVAGVSIKSAMRRAFEEIVAATLMEQRAINAIFAILIAVGVIYNSGRIALAERARDLATLRVLGFTRREVGWILLGEQGMLTLAALIPGAMLGRGLAGLATLLIDSENHRFPLVISTKTYAVAVLITLAAAGVTAWLVSRRVAALSLVAVLKTKE